MAVVAPASVSAAKQPAPALVAAGSPAAGSIALERVWHRYGREPSDGWCLQDLNLSLEPGELLGLLGPSGCGKTTLLRLIAGFERPSRGRVVLDGREVDPFGGPGVRRNIALEPDQLSTLSAPAPSPRPPAVATPAPATSPRP
jgi:ABC-type bacteriocin/lantibiotic exporter with double-glycine peptidase domain